MINYKPKLQALHSFQNFHIDVLRLDLIDPTISGNKWFKLKYNIIKALNEKHDTVLTFGGAHSNHIIATAKACETLQLKSIGVIRGEAIEAFSPTLSAAKECGMQLHFVSREKYKQKKSDSFLEELQTMFGNFYLIPEGGDNAEGILGCMEILDSEWDHDYIFCACGTGTTFAGIVASAKPKQLVVGLSVLKGDNTMPDSVNKSLKKIFPHRNLEIVGNEAFNQNNIMNHVISNAYAFSGYAKHDQILIDFKKSFEAKTNIRLDYIYTNKLFYGVYNLIEQKKLKLNTKILVIHSGGLQGNQAFEARFMK